MRPMLVGLAVSLIALPLSAQTGADRSAVSLGFTIGTTSFGGAADPIEDRADNLRAMPFRPTMWEVSAWYGNTRSRVGLRAAYGQPGLALRGGPAAAGEEAGNDLLIVADNAFKLAAFSATISRRLRRFSTGPSLWPALGILLERWSSPGVPVHSIVGGLLGMHLDIPFSTSISGMVGAEVGFTPGSPFHDEVLPDGFKVRSTWRRTLSAGLVVGM